VSPIAVNRTTTFRKRLTLPCLLHSYEIFPTVVVSTHYATAGRQAYSI